MGRHQSADEIARLRAEWQRDTLGPSLERFDLTEAPDRFYGPDDLPDFDFIERVGFPGQFPFTAGTYPSAPYASGQRGTGYIPQAKGLARAGRYSGYGTAEDTAAYYQRMIDDGQRAGPNVAFDLPTQCGYDSDDPNALGEVGRTGVAIDTLEDFAILYEPFQDDLGLDRIGSNWTINAPAAIIVAMYLALARRRGADLSRLRGTPQNDILKEFIARGTYIFPPRPSMRLVRDMMVFTTDHAPRLNVVSGGGYHIREAGATREQDLGFSMANLIAYLQTGVEAGLDVDVLAARITVNAFGGSMELFQEVALQRAARRMWATIVRDRFGAKNPRSMLLRQPGGAHMGESNATAQRPLNNLSRSVVGAIASVLGGASPNAEPPFDEPLGLGWSREAMQLTEDANRIVQFEARLTEVRDPLAGSYYVEHLTDEMEAAGWAIVEKIDSLGGSVGAIEEGYMQAQVTESAVTRALAIERGEQIVVGVNAFTGPEEIDVMVERHIPAVYDPEMLASASARQIEKLNDVRRRRDGRQLTQALDELKTQARKADANLMPPIIDCVDALASVGEICGVLREAFGEYQAPSL